MVYVAVFWLHLEVFALFRSRGGRKKFTRTGRRNSWLRLWIKVFKRWQQYFLGLLINPVYSDCVSFKLLYISITYIHYKHYYSLQALSCMYNFTNMYANICLCVVCLYACMYGCPKREKRGIFPLDFGHSLLKYFIILVLTMNGDKTMKITLKSVKYIKALTLLAVSVAITTLVRLRVNNLKLFPPRKIFCPPRLKFPEDTHACKYDACTVNKKKHWICWLNHNT